MQSASNDLADKMVLEFQMETQRLKSRASGAFDAKGGDAAQSNHHAGEHDTSNERSLRSVTARGGEGPAEKERDKDVTFPSAASGLRDRSGGGGNGSSSSSSRRRPSSTASATTLDKPLKEEEMRWDTSTPFDLQPHRTHPHPPPPHTHTHLFLSFIFPFHSPNFV